MNKYPDNWPKSWKLRRVHFGEWQVRQGRQLVAVLYQAARGWAYNSEQYGSSGQGYSGHASRKEAMHHLATHFRAPLTEE